LKKKRTKEGKMVLRAVCERASDNNSMLCEICGSSHLCEIHHIFRRGSIEMEETLIVLCWSHHKGTDGVHGMKGHTLDLNLKQDAQLKLRDMGINDDGIRTICKGKLYIDLSEEYLKEKGLCENMYG